MYLDHVCLVDRESQLWFNKATDQACNVTSQELVAGRDDFVGNIQIMSEDMIEFQVIQHYVA